MIVALSFGSVAWMRLGCACAVLLVCAGFAAKAADQPPAADVGRSTFVVNQVDGQAGAAPPAHIAVNDDILFQEDITTGDEAKTIIEFRDGSTFEVGPNAVVRIDSFVFNPEESTSEKTLQVTRGVFRYVSGYVAAKQETKIAEPTGALAIRGSVASGIVDPGVPNFIYVGEGSATFSNSVGSSPLNPGDAIAIPSDSTAPMTATGMPAPVAVQALGVIERYLPPRQGWDSRPPESDDWLQQQGLADLVPAAQQQEQQAAPPARPMPVLPTGGSLAAELGLLVEGAQLGLFLANPGPPTPERTAFLARMRRENPRARMALSRYAAEARALHNQNRAAGTRFVIRGVGHSGASPDVIRRFNEATIRTNPAAAVEIHGEDTHRGNRHDQTKSKQDKSDKDKGKDKKDNDKKDKNRDKNDKDKKGKGTKDRDKKDRDKKDKDQR